MTPVNRASVTLKFQVESRRPRSLVKSEVLFPERKTGY